MMVDFILSSFHFQFKVYTSIYQGSTFEIFLLCPVCELVFYKKKESDTYLS